MEPVQSNSGSNTGEKVVEEAGWESFPVQDSRQPRSLERKASTLTTATAVIWLSSVVAALVLIAKHSNAPGHSGAIPRHWPAQSLIALDANRPTLIMSFGCSLFDTDSRPEATR